MKIFDFCKKFSPEKSKGNEHQTDFVCLIGRNIKMAKFIRLSDDAGFVFLRVRRFSGAAFFHARVRACGHMRARTHLCNACAFIIGARRTEFQLSAFYDSFAKLFYPASSQKAKLRNFRRKTVPKLAKSGKKREIRLETAKKRLFAAMKGRYSSEKAVNRRKKEKKEKNEKKIKKF